MKTILPKCDECRVSGDEAPAAYSRHASRVTRHSRAFTIVELLVVIAIISILAALLLPVLIKAKDAAKKNQAKTEMSQIAAAVQQYDSVYGRFPVSTEDQQLVAAAGTGDFTCGGTNYDITGQNQLWIMGLTNNAEVIAILTDATNYPGGGATPNMNHVKNPQRTIFLNPKMASDNNSPGIGLDGVYRDPWGGPYVITIDLNYDEQCRDSNYCQQAVSQNPPLPDPYVQTGFGGLNNPNVAPVTQADKDNYLYHGKVMVWSAGSDRKIDLPPGPPGSQRSDQGFNKDNVLSWQ